MNKILLLLSSFIALQCFGQSAFQNISFERALQKARKENKLIFLQFESDDCIQCNEVADKAFADNDFAKHLASKFISLKITPNSKERIHVGEKYNISEGFGTLFIDGSGYLIYLMGSTFSTPVSYYTEIETAFKRQRDFRMIEEKEKSYFDGNNKKIADLEALIQAKNNLGLSTDLLLTEYINLTPTDSLNTNHTLHFLIKQSPVYGSKSYNAMTSNKNFKEAWYKLPLTDRIKSNNETFRKSIAVAVKNKDENFAKSVAQAAMRTHSDNIGKQNAYDKNMMSYYSQVRDTTKYFAIAVLHYDKYVDALTPDYLRRMDSTAKSNAFKNPESIISKPSDDGKMMQVRTMRYKSPYSVYSNYLHRVAGYFSSLDKDNKYIDHSLKWAAKSVELSPYPNNQHLYANLLYKAGKIEEAIKFEELAIEKSKEMNSERKEWYPILEKMKKGEPLE